MNTINIIPKRIENIKTVFQDARNFAADCNDIEALIQYIENLESEFRSVAFEGAAMAVAQKDFLQNGSLKFWNQLMSLAKNQSGHVHVGLGWAIAAAPISELSFMNTIHPMMQFRVWDGCGYYNGIFKYRQSITNQTRQHFISEKDFQAYDQGLGRSLWYSCKGDLYAVAENIQKFSSLRHADLWRGVGIASSYVGGCDENILKNLYAFADKHSIQLCIGATMVAKSRTHAGSITKDIALAFNVWCNLSVNEAMQLTTKAETTADSFESFILQMETEITNTPDRVQNPVRGDLKSYF